VSPPHLPHPNLDPTLATNPTSRPPRRTPTTRDAKATRRGLSRFGVGVASDQVLDNVEVFSEDGGVFHCVSNVGALA
jgi:hypothetical protein